MIMEKEELRSRISGLEHSERQRQDAENQLTALREDLAKEQKRAKEKFESLQEVR